MQHDFQEITSRFRFGGEYIYAERYGCGHINDTYAVYFKHPFSRPMRYILQRINHNVFKDPASLMTNIRGVTDHIAKKEPSGDARRVLRIVQTREGQDYYLDAQSCYWRAYHFIEDATAHQNATPELFMQSGIAFGRFADQLSDYPAHTLCESIPDFHNTRKRFETLEAAVAGDAIGRTADIAPEINFARQYKDETGVLVDMLSDGRLPLRVTHNDTKLNNVMIDNITGKGVCVIDLDTVMPGLSLYDFGDSIRFGASTAAEDERDLSRVSMDLALFENYTMGYLSQAHKSLTARELEMLPFAAKLMTYECGIRFLTDYLNGDVYFKTSRPEHNLDRCRTQFRLVADMETKLPQMAKIVEAYSI